MKNFKVLALSWVISLVFLAGCKQAEAPQAAPVQDPFENMTEEERVDAMIKLIEAEEAKMNTAEANSEGPSE